MELVNLIRALSWILDRRALGLLRRYQQDQVAPPWLIPSPYALAYARATEYRGVPLKIVVGKR